MDTEGTNAKASRSGRTILASLAALGSVVLASTCCLPMFPFIFAAGAAGSSAFFARARPFLLAASLLSIAFAFYQRWRAKQCQCKPSLLSTIVLWFSVVTVLTFFLFPQVIANLVANFLARVKMRRNYVIYGLVSVVSATVLFAVYYLYLGSTAPTGQQPLVRLDNSNIDSLRKSFNESADSVRVMVMLSPT